MAVKKPKSNCLIIKQTLEKLSSRSKEQSKDYVNFKTVEINKT